MTDKPKVKRMEAADFERLRSIARRECTCGGTPSVTKPLCNACILAAGFFRAEAEIEQLKDQGRPEVTEPEKCSWAYSRDSSWAYSRDSSWASSCGQDYVFEDGGPVENGVRFCHHCGKPVEVDKSYGPDEWGEYIDPDEPKEGE